MKLEFEKLSLAGFRSFNDKSILLFEPGLHFVRGDNQDEPRLEANGAGKSSLFLALCWTLYGKTPGNLRNPDLLPWSGNKETKVILTVNIDGHQHKITRTINPNNLTLDGQKVGQERIEQLIGFDYEVFTHTILLGQGQPLFFDKGPSEKMQVLSDVLNLERWEKRSELAKERVNDLQQRKSELETNVAIFTNRMAELDALLKTTQNQAKFWDGEAERFQSERNKKLIDYNEELEKVIAVWDEAVLAKDGAGMEADHLRKQLAEYREELYKIDLQMATWGNESKVFQKQMDSLKDVCPTCGQAIKSDIARRRKDKLKQQYKELQGKLYKISNEHGNAQEKVHRTTKQLAEFEEKERKATATYERITPRKVELETKISEIKKYASEQKKQANPYLEQLNQLQKKLSVVEADRGAAEDSLIITGRKMERAQFWVKGFKDVRLFIIEELLTELELVTNTMLENLGLEGWEIHYAIEKETKSGTYTRGLNVTIQSPRNKEPVKWEVWSGGEGQRLRLIGSLALSEVLLNEANVHPNLEILDEPSRGLASGGVDDLVGMLADRAAQMGKTILLVDHHRVRSSKFNSVIQVTKTLNGSTLEVLR